MSGLRRWCLIASISLRHVCHRHGSEPIPENQCPLEPLRRLDSVAGKPSKCYSVLTAQNPQYKVRNTSQILRVLRRYEKQVYLLMLWCLYSP
jgi:hypothetical protein